MDYQTTYDQYWRRPDRVGEHSFSQQGVDQVAQEVQRCVGLGKVLDVGCGHGHLVRNLNTRGCDAWGVDVSNVAVDAANETCPGRFRVGDILALPYEDNSFDCVISTDCFEHLLEKDVQPALAELHRVSRGSVYLRIALTADRDNKWHLTIQNREWWEAQCFAVGFRKHPRHFLASPFGCLDAELHRCTIVLSKLPSEANERYTIEALQDERQLHMDMSREPGRRSDAHIVRYYEAARSVRPGDRVLDAACGLGYGSTVITQNSRCASYVGVDNSDYAVDYARANFPSGADDIRFEKGSLPECLEQYDDASFDFIASFETLEHLRDPRPFLQECKRLLTPGGRLMVSVPNDWADETGVDPNPHHFHVYDWSKVLKELRDEGYRIERTVSETVSRRKENGRWTNYGYEWTEHDVEAARGKPGEWCIVLAMKSPFDVSDKAFHNSAFSEAACESPTNVMAYAEQYENPWLVPSLVTRGLRTDRKQLRRDMAQQVLDRRVPNADEAAALCVKAYTLLGDGAAWRDVEDLLQRCEPHTQSRDWDSAKPIETRWAVSLTYVGALLSLQCGQRDRAKQLFEACASLPFLCYAPILATKTVSAALRRAKLALVDHDHEAARTWFTRGVEASRLAATQDWEAIFGDLTRQPLPVFRELAEVVELGAQCMAGLTLLQGAAPGPVYYEQLDASKAADIEALLAYQKVQNDAIQWHQEQMRNLQHAAEFWHARANDKTNPVERVRKRLSRKLKKLQNALLRRPQLQG
ncbi:methyltransferase domain-containing protein [Botrimarina mediterranea]|uniref:Putative S-adenosylmethionine-dependent methyltransferase/MSMEI_2290 n=1 Tax=Botrimarina mediterranea TaxID=2528022 RepID=A0A518K490_9BACT|nr:methyltransferase domain-containing protein [Botrimarina mediterranea]QDV72614.1 putative S-adenosylmethionine-dependent methyltransferase/MSMEI_2290 [Botrimarina mediterranea]